MRVLTTLEEIAEYRKQFAGIEAPDMAEAVEYRHGGRKSISGSDGYRVCGWYCPMEPYVRPEPQSESDRIGCDIIDEIIAESAQKEVAEALASGKPVVEEIRLRACTREEATHVSLTGVCGAVVALNCSYLTRKGRYVQWGAARIEEEKARWGERLMNGDLDLTHPLNVRR